MAISYFVALPFVLADEELSSPEAQLNAPAPIR